MGNLNAVSQGDLAFGHVAVAGGVPTLQANRGFSAVADNGAGDFTLTMDNAQALLTAGNVQATVAGALFGVVTCEVASATTIRCRVWDAAGMALDNVGFWIRVTPISPQ